MVLINKTASNTLIFTLKERQTLTSPYFLFRFTNDITNAKQTVIMSDTSSYTDRYNSFTLIEGTTVTLSPEGFWKYEVWEQSSAVNTNPDLATTKLETGTARVLSSNPNTWVENTNENDQYVEYGSGT